MGAKKPDPIEALWLSAIDTAVQMAQECAEVISLELQRRSDSALRATELRRLAKVLKQLADEGECVWLIAQGKVR